MPPANPVTFITPVLYSSYTIQMFYEAIKNPAGQRQASECLQSGRLPQNTGGKKLSALLRISLRYSWNVNVRLWPWQPHRLPSCQEAINDNKNKLDFCKCNTC